jgi:sterol 3beta-glucosyltransferase
MAVVNECRREILGLMPLAPRFFRDLDISRLPIVYGFSPNILPAPDDWGEWLKVSGQWFMDDEPDWQPPGDLLHFLDAGVPPIYVGFGSMVDKQIKRVTPIVLQALNRTGQRGILLGGWGGLGQADLPRSVFYIESVPHSWLFPRVSAVVHHGGAGTTATGLRYGKPTVVVPFFADQPFWGHRIYQLGAGPRPITFAKLNAEGLSKAIDQAINDPMMQQNARNLGEKMRVEDGTGKAVDYIQGYLER